MHGLRFIRLVLAGEDAALSHRCNTIEERVRQWKATLRPAKKLQQLKSSTESVSVHDAVAILRSEKLWWDVNSLSEVATEGEATEADLKLIVAAMVTRVAYRCWSRPGAVTGATLAEYSNSVKEVDTKTGKASWVMMVARHNTARQGPASITFTKQDRYYLENYLSLIRPLCNPATDNLFVTHMGQPILKLNVSVL